MYFLSHGNSVGICVDGKVGVIVNTWAHGRPLVILQWKHRLPCLKSIEIEGGSV